MRLRKVKNVEEKIKEFEGLIITEPENHKGKWNKLFGNDNPIHLEIGMGKGKFIIEKAKREPNVNFIGCELVQSIIYKAAKSVDNVLNLLMINYDALKLGEVFDKGEIAKIYLNFSDPWPKSRHEKRRLTSDSFLNVYREIKASDGVIEFKTDNRGLFEFSLEETKEAGWKIQQHTFDLHQDESMNVGNIMTEYEEKFSSMGNPIYKYIIKR